MRKKSSIISSSICFREVQERERERERGRERERDSWVFGLLLSTSSILNTNKFSTKRLKIIIFEPFMDNEFEMHIAGIIREWTNPITSIIIYMSWFFPPKWTSSPGEQNQLDRSMVKNILEFWLKNWGRTKNNRRSSRRWRILDS